MKSNRVCFLYTLIHLLGIMTVSGLFGRDYSVERDETKKFTGSKVVNLEEAVSKSTAIFVGRLLSSQAGAASAAGSMAYLCKVKTIRVLKGNVDPEASFQIVAFDGWDEIRPKDGDGYVFFMESPEWAFKLSPASKKNIDAVVRMLSKHPH